MNTYDQGSGQVFREWSVNRGALIHGPTYHDWSRHPPNPGYVARGVRGPRSLVDMATSKVAHNIGYMTDHHMEAMPPRLRWRVWRFLEARELCLHAWKLFSKSLLTDDEEKTLGLYRYRQHICKTTRILTYYTEPLISLTAEFVTHLVISGGCAFKTNELLCLTDIKNLAVLEIIQPAGDLASCFPEITDRLVRGWSEKDDPFPLLRVLRIWGDQSTTQESFRYIDKFPALALYDVMGHREDWTTPNELAQIAGFELAESVSRLNDSLTRYLLLLSRKEDGCAPRFRGGESDIDSDLVGTCSDERCLVKFTNYGEAPELLEYLNDPVKIQNSGWNMSGTYYETHSCRSVTFEAWAFWLYSLIGQITHDQDLRDFLKEEPTKQAVAGPFVLPSKPIACLYLGHSGRGGISAKPSYVSRGMFATKRYTFTRPSVLWGDCPRQPAPDITSSTEEKAKERRNKPKMEKRKRLHDMLESMMDPARGNKGGLGS